jgi:cupin 2 domain-containing protein
VWSACAGARASRPLSRYGGESTDLAGRGGEVDFARNRAPGGAAREYRAERIISLGHASPEGLWYDQATTEYVLLVKGVVRLRCDGGQPTDMQPGSFVNILAQERRRLECTDPTQPTIWMAGHHREEPP